MATISTVATNGAYLEFFFYSTAYLLRRGSSSVNYTIYEYVARKHC